MKKIFLILTILVLTISVKSQNIDTVLIRPGLTMQAQDWAWIFGKYDNTAPDSATAFEIRRIRNKIRTANPASFTTNVSVDSIKGTFALTFYKMVKSANAGEIAARYTAITTAIEAVSIMSTFISTYNAALLADFNRKRDRGKTIVMDN